MSNLPYDQVLRERDQYRDMVKKLRRQITYAVDMLDGEEEGTVPDCELVRKMQEHLEAYRKAFNLVATVEGMAWKEGVDRTVAAAWVQILPARVRELEEKLARLQGGA